MSDKPEIIEPPLFERADIINGAAAIKGPEVKDTFGLVRYALTIIGAQGLCNSEIGCGCKLDDLAPCGEIQLEPEAVR